MYQPNFIHLSSVPDTEMKMGRTMVVRRVGNAIEKLPRFGLDMARWLSDVASIRNVTDDLRRLHNPMYKIPRTYISHGRVREEFVPGHTLSVRCDKNRDFLIPAIANLITDMAKIRPIKYGNECRVQSVWFIDNLNALDKMLGELSGGARMAPHFDQELIRTSYAYVSDLPENREMVFSHNDLTDGNIIIDDDGNVNFIDFASAGYRSRLWVRRSLNANASWFSCGPDAVWDMANKLSSDAIGVSPWNIAPEILELQDALLRTCFALKRFYDGHGQTWDKVAGVHCVHLRECMARQH